jgi:hypothetical protein
MDGMEEHLKLTSNSGRTLTGSGKLSERFAVRVYQDGRPINK